MYKNMHWQRGILTGIHIIVNLIDSLQVPKLNWAKIKPLMALLKNRSSVAHLKPWISLKILNRILATSAALISIYFLIKIKHVLKALHNRLFFFHDAVFLTREKVSEQTNCLPIFNYTNWRTGFSHYNNPEAYHKQTMPWS